MSNVVDTLVTRYELDDSNYKAGASGVTSATMQMSGPMAGLVTRATQLQSKFTALGPAGVAAALVITKVAVAFGVLAQANRAAIDVARQAVPAFAEFDALNMSLKAIEGSSKGAEKALRAMTEAAKLPGLGFQQSVQGFVRLRQAGMNEAQSQRLILASGNANALSGGGAERLERVLLAFSQMFGKGKVSGEELMQLTEAGIPAQSLLLKKYGTSDADELKRKGITFDQVMETIIVALEAMPKAGNNAANLLENMSMAINKFKVDLGGGIVRQLGGDMAAFGNALGAIADSGAFTVLGDAIGGALTALNPFAGEMDGVTKILLSGIAAGAAFYDTMGAVNTALISTAKAFIEHPFVKMMAKVMKVGLTAAGGVDVMAAMGSFDENFAKRQAEVMSRYQEYKNRPSEGNLPGDPSFLGGRPAPVIPGERHLAEIADNTRRMADLQAQILGGGNQGRIGLTAHELAGIGGSDGPVGRIMAGIADLMMMQIHQSRKMGY